MDTDRATSGESDYGRVRFPEAVRSMSTDSLTRKNNVLGFLIPHCT
jgi:hypothetical protein